ncbi:MAG TPA: hypothetical protein VKR32_19660, partial [Puia sp.]|nr:hypothetical protein [Puia sp.]
MSKQELTKPSSQDKKLSKKKNLLFKLIASLFPLFILFLLEILLRFFDYGDNMDLFIRSKNDENLLVLNPSAARKYFVNEGLAPTGNREFFKKKKDKNTFRVFVLGESTTIGYPYFHNGSFSRWLLYRLTHTLPDKQFEIINLSLTGVNSYTVLDFAKELIRYEPDAVLIYCGQNEYYGALGVGSTNKLGGNKLLIRLMLKLRTLRTIQLLSNCYEKILHAGLFNEKTKSGTLMQMMVADQQIAYQSKLYYRGIEQFRSNLNETLCLINSQHIPVFVSTLVSNDKDLKPFIDIAADSAHFPGFKTKYEAGLSALGNHDSAAADSYFKKANEVYDKDALCNYYLGVLACGQAKYKVADNLFSMARDLDGLRFRAPSELNVIIRELCKTYPYAHLVDSRTAFENFSNDHLIGNDLMVDHVHPNLKGYGIISDAFYRAIKEAAIIAIPSQEEMSLDQLEQQMPITKVDSLSGVYRIARLKKSWPFQEIGITDSFKSESKEQTLAYEMAFEGLPWKFAIDSLYNYYIAKNDLLNAARVMQTLVLEYPAESSL